MAESSVDRVLELIDAGLQSTTEASCQPGDVAEDPDDPMCLRCRSSRRADGIEMCVGCRAFLLGDSTADPAAQERRGVRAENVRVVPLDADGNPVGPSVTADGPVRITTDLYADQCVEPPPMVWREMEITFYEPRPELLRCLREWTPAPAPGPFRILLLVPRPSDPRWDLIRTGPLAGLCDTADTYRPPATDDDGWTVVEGPAVVIEETQVRVAMCGTCGCPVRHVITSREPELDVALSDPMSVVAPPRLLRVEPCGHRWDGQTPSYKLWAHPITELPAVAAWAARWLARFDHAAGNPGFDPVLGVVDPFEPGTGPGGWQAEARAHLEAAAAADMTAAMAVAAGLDPDTAARLRDEETAAACEVTARMAPIHLARAHVARARVMDRAVLAAAGLDCGPPGAAGQVWRIDFDPRTEPGPPDREEFWWRRAMSALRAGPNGAPLWVTSEERHEIRHLFPLFSHSYGVGAYQSVQGDDWRYRETLFGAPLEVLPRS